ncbi:MAG: hypothetical protein IKD70_08740 [Eggerthellaceae bacterium]|nr:hypothetical protein [Eggerthellaceae bacterium]
MPKTVFVRKPVNLSDVTSALEANVGPYASKGRDYYVAEERQLSNREWEDLTSWLLKDREWIKAFSAKNFRITDRADPCIRVTCPSSEIALIIDPQGYDYARYVGIEDAATSSEIEEEDEPMYDDEAEELTEEEVVDGLRALLMGDSLDCTMLDNCNTRTYVDGGYLTYDQGFVIETPDGHRFQITVKQEC